MTRPLDGHPLPEQFAALPEDLQAALFSMVDVAGAMDQAEKWRAEQELSYLTATDIVKSKPFLLGLLKCLSRIVMNARITEESAQIEAAVERLTITPEEKEAHRGC